jgi:hypothetical protein
MSAISVFNYSNYRHFLSDLIKSKGHTYDSFSARYGQIISKPALAKLLSRGRNGQRPPQYRISPETLAKLAKTLGLSDSEIAYLCLLRFENDADSSPGLHGQTLKRVLCVVIDGLKNAQISAASAEYGGLSKTVVLSAELLETLPNPHRKRAIAELIHEGRVYSARHRDNVEIKDLQSKIEKLARLNA